MQISDREVQYFPPKHNLNIFETNEINLFRIEDYGDAYEMKFVFGVQSIDRKKADPYDPESLGEVIW